MSPAWLLKSVEPRTEPSGLASDDPAVKRRDISISVGDASCQQKADGKMKGIQKEMLSDSLKFIRVTESGRTPMRGVLLWGFLCPTYICIPLSTLSFSAQLSVCLLVSSLPVCLFPCLSACLPVCSPVHSPSVSESAAMPPTPQPTDDVDIYFETPADDKEHSRFQRAKEQLEIRHRNRMERVSHQVETRWSRSSYCRLFEPLLLQNTPVDDNLP